MVQDHPHFYTHVNVIQCISYRLSIFKDFRIKSSCRVCVTLRVYGSGYCLKVAVLMSQSCEYVLITFGVGLFVMI